MFKRLIFIYAILLCIYFSYYAWADFVIKEISLETETPVARIEKWESIYNPIFHSTHGFYGIGSNKSISLQIAEAYWKAGDFDKARENYDRAYKQSPNDFYVSLGYAQFLLFQGCEEEQSLALLDKLHFIQRNYSQTNLLLADIYIRKGDHKKVRELLNCRYLDRSNYTLLFLECKLYTSEYLRELCELDDFTFNKIMVESKIQEYEMMEFRESLLNKYISKEENKIILSKLKTFHTRLEKVIFNNLNTEQRMIYLNDIASNLYGYNFFIFSYYTRYGIDKISEIEQTFKTSFVLQKYCTMIKNVSSIKKDINCDIALYVQKQKQELFNILNKREQRGFQNYYNSGTWLLLNRY